MKKYTDRNRKKVVEYKVENKVLLSTKDLTWQIRNKETKKLIKKFMRLYKIKKIILENIVELELLVLMKIYLVVSVSRIVLYQEQIKKQKKILSLPVEIDREKKYEVEKILNRRDVREKPKYLVRQKGYIVEKDTWKELENLGNTIDLVEKFLKEIRKKVIRRVQMRKKKGKKRILNLEAEILRRSELLEKYIARILFGWNNGKFEDKYLKKLERNWARWKRKGRQVPPKVKP